MNSFINKCIFNLISNYSEICNAYGDFYIL